MSITIDKILTAEGDPDNLGKLRAKFILTDGVIKKKCQMNNLPNNKNQARSMILARGQEIFNKWQEYEEPDIKLDTIDNLLEAEIDAIDLSNISNIKAILKKALKKKGK